MKKHLIAIAVASAVTAPAMAQVTVGGALDTSYVSKTQAIPVSASSVYNSNGSRSATSTQTATVNAVDNSFWSTSNINFKGTEDLGGGLKAFFHLEGAVLTDTGSADLANRVSQVGVEGAFGTVTLGRGSTAMNDASTSGGHGLGNFANLPFSTAARPNNAINYVTPTFNGFNARVTLGEGESSKDDSNGDYSAMSLHGKVGAFSFTVAQASQKAVRSASTGRAYAFNSSFNGSVSRIVSISADPDTGVFGATPAVAGKVAIGAAANGTWTTANILSLTRGVAAVNGKNRDTIVTGAYDMGVATIRFQHLRSKSSGTVENGENGIALVNRTINAVTLTAPMGAATVFLNYQEHDRSKDQKSSSTAAQNALAAAVATNKNDVTTVGVNYALSKRTSAYVVHRSVDNDAGSNYLSGVSGKNAKATAIGLRHSF